MTHERVRRQRPTASWILDVQSREEEAAYWDTRDVTEFLDDRQPVQR